MSYRSLPRRLGATALSVLAAVSLSIVGLAGVASAGGALTVSLSGVPGQGLTLTATPSGGTAPYTYAWYDCTAAVTGGTTTLPPSTCTISATSSNSATHVVSAADVTAGPYITAAVTDSTGPTANISDAPSVIGTSETVTINGTASAGATLQAAPFAGTPTYQWYDCTTPVGAGYIASTPPSNCIANSGTNSSYQLGGNDYGYYVTVTALLSPATTYAVAASTVVVTEPAPTVSGGTLGVTSANVEAGTTATTTSLNTAFSNLYNNTATYQWYDCSAQVSSTSSTLPSGCTAIATSVSDPSTASSYTFAVGDLYQYVLVQVTETNAAGSATLYSTSTSSAISGSSPSINGLSWPQLGTQIATQVAISTLGTWTGSPLPSTYTYTWYRCTATGLSPGTTLNGTCYAIAGSSATVATNAPAASYTFTSADIGHTVVLGVTANNGIYSPYEAYSGSSATFNGSAPTVAVDPAISGTATVGDVLTASTGTWSGAPLPTTFSYEWYLCTLTHTPGAGQSTSGLPGGYSDCGATGFTGSTYTVPSGAVGKYVLVQLTTNNGVGSFSYETATVGAVAAASLANAGAVSISEGSNGTYTATVTPFTGGTPAPTTYSYTWYDCRLAGPTPAAPSTNLPNLTNCTQSYTSTNSTTHAVTSSDVTLASGGGLMVVASTTTVAGTQYVNSTTSSIASLAPTGGSVSVSGSGSLSSPFTATASWTAIPAPSISYVWYMCQSANLVPPVAGCLAQSAFSSTFSPTTYNVSYPYAIVVATASNGVGTNTQTSTGVLLSPQPLVVTTYPTVTVTPVPTSVTTASMLSVSSGVWQGVPAPTFSYQWFVCSSLVATPSSSVPGGCSAIPGASSSTYIPSGGYVGQYFLAEVTGTNGYPGSGSLGVFTPSTSTGLISTLSITSLTISGTATVGSTLVATGVVNAQTSYTTAYQWYQCSLSVTAMVTVPYYCTKIVGATSPSFTPTTAQSANYLTVEETVTFGSSTATAVATSTALITTNIPGPPTSVTAYAGAGQATVSWLAPSTGLTASSYTVTASPGTATCTATTTTCVVTGLLYGTSYTFTVTATNAYGTGAPSVASASVSPSETVPGAPSTVTATAGALSATVTWTAAAQNGSAIISYTVTSSPGGLSCTATVTTCTVSGLVAGTPYTFTVSARNAVGVGPASFVSAAVTPRPNTPNGPVGVSTKRGNHQLTVSWSAGAANGATVSGYVVTATGGGASKTCSTTSALSCTVTGLTNGVPYSVTVVAQSASGSSPLVNGPAMVPAGPPSAPSIYHSARGAGVVIVYFRAPAQINGAPVAYYQYLINGRWTVQPVKGKLFIVLRGLARHHAYIVRVRAVSVGGASASSNYVRVITL